MGVRSGGFHPRGRFGVGDWQLTPAATVGPCLVTPLPERAHADGTVLRQTPNTTPMHIFQLWTKATIRVAATGLATVHHLDFMDQIGRYASDIQPFTGC